ncbi:hypothetical protein IHV10_16335 [Fictibacillus sp. 5RED26]|uniref:hypothetical protein n=1 Tax=unclassified Fictibacillus TaxID=2644029 RepID=UPI0018CF234D|nr:MULTISPECIES: hypothetical protein [unclassified Fictibacillus]MBH0157950.1 hypothetical protein [Fictibacillus sp. 5RED26]MBH0175927.1 hypothetical protein [Fictibacillus sp. 23RED33]
MKKLITLLLIIGLLTVTACSKDTKQNEQGTSETKAEKEESTDNSTSEPEKEDSEATETTTTEDDNSNAEGESENSDSEQTDYLTSEHQFVASELTNSSEKQISDRWGKPTRSEKIQFRYSGTTEFVPAIVNYYQNDKYAVTFVEGKAARLVYSVIDEEIMFNDEEMTRALELAGLPVDVEETTDTDTAYVYNDLGNIYEVTMFSKGEFVDYLYIILDEAYK